MTLRDLAGIFRRRLVWVVAITVLGGVLGFVATLVVPKTYEAHTTLYFTATDNRDAAALSQGAQYVQSQIRSYPLLITAPAVLEPVSEDTGLAPDAVEAAVSASVPTDSALLDITTTSPDPDQAAALANSFATRFSAQIQQLETRPGERSSPIRVSTVAPASAPESPAQPSVSRYLLIGLVGGLILGALAAVIRDLLARR